MRMIDAIQLKISIACSNIIEDGKTLEQIIDEQPTVEPERKRGKWIEQNWTRNNTPTELCSECSKWSLGRLEKYCPNCGCEMER